DLQHVGVVPVPRAREFLQSILGESDDRHAVPSIIDISRRAPQIPRSWPPCPRRLDSPIANAEHDRPSGLCQGVAKLGVLHLRIESFGVAPVYLHVIHAPCGISLCILKLVPQTSRPFLTS